VNVGPATDGFERIPVDKGNRMKVQFKLMMARTG
jgi:hypothetical protein